MPNYVASERYSVFVLGAVRLLGNRERGEGGMGEYGQQGPVVLA